MNKNKRIKKVKTKRKKDDYPLKTTFDISDKDLKELLKLEIF